MVETDKLNALLVAFARTLVTDYPVDRMLDDLCDRIVAILGCHGAGVMLEDDEGTLRFVSASDDGVRQIESLQIELGEGPCLEAYRTGEVVLVDDLASDARFSAFSPRALQAGLAAVQSFPLVIDGESLGALNMYSKQPAKFGDEEIAAGRVLADVCTAYICNARTLEKSHQLADQLQRALESRVVIEQAKGKLAEQLQVPVSDAFEIMRRYARNNGRKLHQVATEIVRNELKLSESRA